jgi:filamentous hemagglutinin family protein
MFKIKVSLGAYIKLIIAGVIINAIISFNHRVIAQITPDNTLPTNSQVTKLNSTINIEGGSRAGNNLFHSFSSFSIPTDIDAHFQNTPDVENIISRVTGNNISNINGLIKANGTANLFLINPSGIIFGEKAKLDIGGSFSATGADSIKFGESLEFSAKNPLATPILSINVPVGLQYGSNPGDIEVLGTNLQLIPGKTLTLAGAVVNINGGKLLAPSGRVELGDTNAQTNVLLNNKAEVNVLGDNGGSIALAANKGPSGAFTSVEPTGIGNAGNVNITSKTLRVANGAQLSSSSTGKGAAGNLGINADLISLDNQAAIKANTIGGRGNIDLNARNLILYRNSNNVDRINFFLPDNIYAIASKNYLTNLHLNS